jgi:hypothetical protein
MDILYGMWDMGLWSWAAANEALSLTCPVLVWFPRSSETSDTALQHFAALNVLDLVIPCLEPARFPPGVVLAAAQCLQTVTEDNPLLCAALAKHPGCLQGTFDSLHRKAMAPFAEIQLSHLQTIRRGASSNEIAVTRGWWCTYWPMVL